MSTDPPKLDHRDDEALLLECLSSDGDRTEALEVVCRAHPDRASALRELYRLLDQYGLVHEPAVPPLPAEPERIGPYRVLGRLGRGGMGVVYLAEHEQLGRRVALKVIHAGLADTPKARERFRREAVAAARLDHPGICPVHEIGTADGVPFLAMRHVPGESLQAAIGRSRAMGRTMVELPTSRRPADRNAVLQLVEQVADALHAAHEAGLVHRDVKPGNVLVTPAGEPVLVDFGLARAASDEDHQLTRTGDQLGTPGYMAPEQVSGSAVDRRTDVHALGVLLYECLTLRLPFEAANLHDLQSQILRDEPSRPTGLGSRDARDLWIVLRTALAKEPDRRYRTALAFAEDLRRVRMHEPILARPATPWLRLRRFARRNPLATAFVACAAVALVVFAALVVQRGRALETAARALRTAAANEQALRARESQATTPRQAMERALAAVDAERNVDTVSALHAAVVLDHERARLQHGAALWTAEFDPRGELLLTCSDDGSARLWDRAGRPVATLPHTGQVGWAEFSADGRHIATASFDGTVVIWDRNGQPRHRLQHDEGGRRVVFQQATFDPSLSAMPWLARFSPDGRFLVTTAMDRRARVFTVDRGEPEGEPFVHVGPLGMAVWSSQGLIATLEDCMDLHPGKETFAAEVWRPGALQHERIARWPLPDSSPWGQFSPDGRSLVVACRDGNAYLFAVDEPKAPPVALRHLGPVWRAAFSPDGKKVVTAAHDATVRVFARDGTPLHERRLDGPMFEATWAAAGTRVLATSYDNSVRLFDAELHELLVLRGHHERTFTARLSPDGRQLLSSSWDRTARLWDLVDARVPRLLGHARRVRALALLRDGRVVSIGDDRSLRIWDLATGSSRVLDIAAGASGLALDRAEAHALIAHDDSVARRYDLGSEQLAGEYPDVHGAQIAATFLGEGSVLVSGLKPLRHRWSLDGATMQPWGTARGDRSHVLTGPTATGLVAAGGWGRFVSVWNETGELQAQWPVDPAQAEPGSSRWTHALAFSPGSDHLAIGSADGTVRVYALAAGRPVDPEHPLRLPDHDGKVLALAWSPDGALLATGASDGAARLWDVASGALRAVLRGHRGEVHAVLFTRDGRLLTAGDDGAIQAWVVATDELVALARNRLQR